MVTPNGEKWDRTAPVRRERVQPATGRLTSREERLRSELLAELTKHLKGAGGRLRSSKKDLCVSAPLVRQVKPGASS